MRNYNIDESSTARHVDELHSIRRAMMVSALPKRRVKRSKKHGIHRAGGLFSPPIDPIGNWNLLNLDITSSGHVGMLQLFEAGLRTDFTPCSEYSLSPISVRVSSLPTSYMSFLLHTPDIHPSIHPPQDTKCDKRNATNKQYSARRKHSEAAGFNFTSYKGRQVFLKDMRNGNCYDCCVRD